MRNLVYDDFIGRSKARRPVHGQIELTSRCNYDCIHCYCKKQQTAEMELPFWEDIITQIREMGGLEITFTGGEPLLYKGFNKLYEFSIRRGFLISIFTSGYELNESLFDLFTKIPPHNIEITLNSLDEQNYESITGSRNSFKKVMANIERIKEKALPLVLKCNGLRENKDEILRIKLFTERLLGKGRFKFDAHILPALDLSKRPLTHRLNAEEIGAIERNDPDILKQQMSNLCELKKQTRIRKGSYYCNAWFNTYYINSQGILQFCQLTKKYSTDLKVQSFSKGFEAFSSTLNERPKTNSRCNDCEYALFCYRCPASAYLETGDEETPVKYYCSLAKSSKDFMEELAEMQRVKRCT